MVTYDKLLWKMRDSDVATAAPSLVKEKYTILNADIATLNTVPVSLTSAPWAGLMLVPITVIAQYTGTTGFTVNTTLEIYFDTLTNTYMTGGNIINQTSSSTSPFAVVGSQNHCMIGNKGLKLRIANANPTANGNWDVVLYVTYTTITL